MLDSGETEVSHFCDDVRGDEDVGRLALEGGKEQMSSAGVDISSKGGDGLTSR